MDHLICMFLLYLIAYCPEEFNGGLLWPRTSSSQVSLLCSDADPLFERKTMTTRQCDADGVWSKLDLSTCTLIEQNLIFVLAWFVVEEEGERVNSAELKSEVHVQIH